MSERPSRRRRPGGWKAGVDAAAVVKAEAPSACQDGVAEATP